MADDHDAEPTQQTRPKKGEPIEIPVPKKGDVMAFLETTAKLADPDRSKPKPKGAEDIYGETWIDRS
jgi:hypothetical protein